MDKMKRKVDRPTLQSLGGFFFVRPSCTGRMPRDTNRPRNHFFPSPGKKGGVFRNELGGEP